jgi:hypothetical protein
MEPAPPRIWSIMAFICFLKASGVGDLQAADALAAGQKCHDVLCHLHHLEFISS